MEHPTHWARRPAARMRVRRIGRRWTREADRLVRHCGARRQRLLRTFIGARRGPSADARAASGRPP